MKVVRNCIEYEGIVDCIPCDVIGFNDCIIEKINILKNQPKIKYFTKCKANIVAGDVEILKFDDNQYKASVEGILNIRVEYLSSDYDNLICAERKQIDFNIIIDISEEFDGGTKIITNLFIEDMYLKKINEEKYFISFSILGIVEE